MLKPVRGRFPLQICKILGDIYMAWKDGRFVIHYIDGSTIVEDRKDPYAWESLLKYITVCNMCMCQFNYNPPKCTKCGADNSEHQFRRVNIIRGIGTIFDPAPSWDDPWETMHYSGFHYGQMAIIRPWGNQVAIEDRFGRQVRNAPIEHVMVGSQSKNYFFWMEKLAYRQTTGKGGTYGMRMGKLTSPNGDCEVVETRVNRAAKHYSTTVYSLNLNLELFDLIHCLKDAGRVIDYERFAKGEGAFKPNILNLTRVDQG